MLKTAIDRIHTDALLYLALTEKLIEIDRSNSDHLDERLLRYCKPSTMLRQSILSQIVFSPRLVTATRSVNKDWIRGHLIDEEYISYEEIQKIDFSASDTIPLGVMESMLLLKDSGYNLKTAIDACKKFDEFNSEYIKYFSELDKPVPDYTAELDFILNEGYGETKYTREELDRKHIFDNKLREIRPILNCIDDYYQVLNLSEKIKGTFYCGIPKNASNSTEMLVDNQMALYELVVQDLGALPYRNTLVESLELAQSSEIKAIRGTISYWIHSIRYGKIKSFQEIRQEIALAIKSLQKAQSAKNIGNFCTYIGLPMSLAGVFNPIASIPGVIVSLVGVGSLGYVNYLEEKYEYAMIGNK